MVIKEFLEKRKSTRDYSRKKLSDDIIRDLSEGVKKANGITNEFGARFRLYENGKEIAKKLQGHAGYDGVMIEAPLYIALAYDGDNTRAKIYGAFYLEQLTTIADQLELGHCWVTLDETNRNLKEELFEELDEEVHYLMAIGYPAKKFLWGTQEFSSRIGVDSFVFKDQLGEPVDVEFLDQLGLKDIFYNIRYAPSTKNKQPWAFVIKEDENVIELYLKDDKQADYSVDIGIMIFYFQSLASFSGIPADFQLVDREEVDGYRLMATTKF